jgi:predicted GIY-YIG superfamily endonuclease
MFYPPPNPTPVTPAFVYLLRCSDGSLYCGWTVDVAKRLAAHASGRASRYTASRAPVALAAAWELPSRTEARRLEARIKRLPRTEKLALARGAPLDGATPVRFSAPAP